jgi:lipopolysaccharide biosynthesis glycosyltransferase
MSQERSVVHLALSFDQGYVTPLFVLLTSIFNNNKEVAFHIHAVPTRVDDDSKNRISTYVHSRNSEISFYDIDVNAVDTFALPSYAGAHLTSAAYNRLFLPNLIPNSVSTLLHVDIDTLVVGDIREVYNLDIGSLPVAAVIDAGMPIRKDLGIYKEEDYFNSGVLLMNVEQWKRQRITERAIEVIQEYPEKVRGYADQDALNIVLKNNWYKMGRRFNMMGMYSPKGLNEQQRQQFLKDVIIIHFNGPKPWKYLSDCDHAFAYLYNHYFKESPVSNKRRYTDVELSYQFINKLAYKKALYLYNSYPAIGKVWRKIKSMYK